MQAAPFYSNYVSDTVQEHSPPPKKTRVVVASKDLGGDSVDLKKMLGVLIILIIVVFFTVLIGIVVTLMKPGCKCNTTLPMHTTPPFYGPVPTSFNNLPFV